VDSALLEAASQRVAADSVLLEEGSQHVAVDSALPGVASHRVAAAVGADLEVTAADLRPEEADLAVDSAATPAAVVDSAATVAVVVVAAIAAN